MNIGENRSDRIFNIINLTILSVFLILVLYPCIYVISASISKPDDVITGRMWLFPVSFALDAYEAVFGNEMIWVGYRNSLINTVVSTFFSVTLTLFAAYPLSRKNFWGKEFFSFLFAFTMFFSGGLIPSYLLVRDLGMLNTRAALIVPGMFSVWNMVITRTFIQNTLPEELSEAAKIDGCSDFKFFFMMLLPLSGAIIAVITLFYAVGQWNSFFSALLYISDKNLYPLQLVIRNILVVGDALLSGNYVDPEDLLKLDNLRNLMKYAIIVIASVPLLMLYPFIQKYFVRGIMIGSLKG